MGLGRQPGSSYILFWAGRQPIVVRQDPTECSPSDEASTQGLRSDWSLVCARGASTRMSPYWNRLGQPHRMTQSRICSHGTRPILGPPPTLGACPESILSDTSS